MINKFKKEFSEFIAQGNVLDMAVGVIMGGAFGKIVTSLVDNIIMPIVGMLLGGKDFSSLSIVIGEATIKYGLFIQSVVDFLIIAFFIFWMLKLINAAKVVVIEETEEITENQTEESIEDILSEIRDQLKETN